MTAGNYFENQHCGLPRENWADAGISDINLAAQPPPP
jgi:hypothetical protein